jgi:hypothetical protein
MSTHIYLSFNSHTKCYTNARHKSVLKFLSNEHGNNFKYKKNWANLTGFLMPHSPDFRLNLSTFLKFLVSLIYSNYIFTEDD